MVSNITLVVVPAAAPPKIEMVPVKEVIVPDGRRSADPEKVKEIAESLGQVGLLQPITVYRAEDSSSIRLNAGLHRLEAAKLRGWASIAAIFIAGDEIDRRLVEIAENLHRKELTALERAEQVSEWVRLTDAKRKAESGFSDNLSGKPGRPKGGAAAASRELGLHERAVQRHVEIDSMSPEAKVAAKEAGLDNNQSALQAIAKETPDRQPAKVAEISAAAKVAIKPSTPAPPQHVVSPASAATKALHWLAPISRVRFFESVLPPDVIREALGIETYKPAPTDNYSIAKDNVRRLKHAEQVEWCRGLRLDDELRKALGDEPSTDPTAT